MNVGQYLSKRTGVIFLNILALIVLSIFLFSVGNTFEVIKIILITWCIVLATYLYYEYISMSKYFKEIRQYIENTDKKYILSEIIEKPKYIEEVPYYEILRKSSKSMREEINIIKKQQKDYKEYIEKWIHEVKAPISAIKLIQENNKTSTSRVVLQQLEEIDAYVEQALFYARSEDVEKDYLVKEINLEECINKVITRNKQVLILNNIDIELQDIDKNVYCDSKWLEFILNQIIVNSIKYRKIQDPTIKIYSSEIKNGVMLRVYDNGIGIPKSEINRVFDKGFTGNKGRVNHKSTGIGLYLCKNLCDKLGLMLQINSKENEYTEVNIIFPRGNFSKFD
ncbi:sensor histidine kinase [Romboutsia weinsteinii]|uniref:histidine kinase n=1 Tax=Romboutsia weinsteinii TaxID=2020949 RepID=A0A371IY53_9FIRM|nr:sensor histidine kinase [Romboutsia weinsteinii]RDY25394.1 sensor histidine kinase [Romboutsia weinsteinii]